MARELGPALREARRARGIELSEVHRVLKIRLAYLQAMEEDRWDELPGHAYARGFLATYAHYLGLDHEQLVEAYETGPGSTDEIDRLPPDTLPHPGQVHKRRRLRLRLPHVSLAALVLLALAGVMAWGLLHDSNPGSGSLEEGGTRSAQDDRISESAPEAEQAPPPEQEPAQDAVGSESASAAEDAARTTVRLTATGSVWVCLEEDDGEVLIDGEVLAAGEKRGPFKPKRGQAVAIGLGNGSIEITVDGEPVDVPATSDPVGFRIRDGVARALDAPDRPECV
jgi:cytoskeleton protein RodZ